MARAAAHPNETARTWKREHGGKVVGSFPMHFPSEIVHAAGALPVILQEADEPITVGHNGMYPFFCGYTRSVVDQASKGDFDFLDAIMFGDHCVQVLSAADVIRARMPGTQVGFYQLIASLRDAWSFENAERALRRLIEGVEEALGVSIRDEDLSASIRLFNENRGLIRRLYDLRRSGEIDLKASELQHVVKSSMVMDKAEHNALLRELVASVGVGADARGRRVPLYVSGHLCQAPKVAILDLIESCGVAIVDDDLYHGHRYVATDVDETGDPVRAVVRWYLDRNYGAPCPTRLDPKMDWDGWLLKAVERSNAKGMIVLLAKFCEPHYFYYPRIKKTFETHGVPHLLLETEHDLGSTAHMQTRVEAFVEMIQRRDPS